MILLIFSLSSPCIPALLSLRPTRSRSPSLEDGWSLFVFSIAQPTEQFLESYPEKEKLHDFALCNVNTVTKLQHYKSIA